MILERTIRLATVVLAFGVCALAFHRCDARQQIQASGETGNTKEHPDAVSREPRLVELSLGQPVTFVAEDLRKTPRVFFLSGRNGEVWVFLLGWSGPLRAARAIDSGLSPFKPISPAEWNGVERVSVANDASGNPVAIMMGCVKDFRNMYVAVRQWSGQSWSAPVELDHYDGTGHAGAMISALDSRGCIHVVYNRPLNPRESYSRGFVIVDGEFPDKCFHAVFDGQQWKRSTSTTGRGRFYVDPVFLSELTDGRLCLGMEVHAFSNVQWEPRYEGYQLWDGRAWSGIAKDKPRDAFKNGDETVFDYWGNRLSLRKDVGIYQAVLQRSDSKRPPERITLKSEPIVKRDWAGRIVVFSRDLSQAEMRVWCGNDWSNTLSFPIDEKLRVAHVLLNPDGNICVVCEKNGSARFVVQRVRMVGKE